MNFTKSSLQSLVCQWCRTEARFHGRLAKWKTLSQLASAASKFVLQGRGKSKAGIYAELMKLAESQDEDLRRLMLYLARTVYRCPDVGVKIEDAEHRPCQKLRLCKACANRAAYRASLDVAAKCAGLAREFPDAIFFGQTISLSGFSDLREGLTVAVELYHVLAGVLRELDPGYLAFRPSVQVAAKAGMLYPHIHALYVCRATDASSAPDLLAFAQEALIRLRHPSMSLCGKNPVHQAQLGTRIMVRSDSPHPERAATLGSIARWVQYSQKWESLPPKRALENHHIKLHRRATFGRLRGPKSPQHDQDVDQLKASLNEKSSDSEGSQTRLNSSPQRPLAQRMTQANEAMEPQDPERALRSAVGRHIIDYCLSGRDPDAYRWFHDWTLRHMERCRVERSAMAHAAVPAARLSGRRLP